MSARERGQDHCAIVASPPGWRAARMYLAEDGHFWGELADIPFWCTMIFMLDTEYQSLHASPLYQEDEASWGDTECENSAICRILGPSMTVEEIGWDTLVQVSQDLARGAAPPRAGRHERPRMTPQESTLIRVGDLVAEIRDAERPRCPSRLGGPQFPGVVCGRELGHAGRHHAASGRFQW